jgi:hypothetical protein
VRFDLPPLDEVFIRGQLPAKDRDRDRTVKDVVGRPT